MNDPTDDHSIVVFDGDCIVCNRWVKYIISRDPWDRFRFAASGSEAGERLLRAYGVLEAAMFSMILVEGGRIYQRSSAILRIGRQLRGVWPIVWVAVVIPEPVRDWVYDKFAAHRYFFFGRRTACELPGPGMVHRFIS